MNTIISLYLHEEKLFILFEKYYPLYGQYRNIINDHKSSKNVPLSLPLVSRHQAEDIIFTSEDNIFFPEIIFKDTSKMNAETEFYRLVSYACPLSADILPALSTIAIIDYYQSKINHCVFVSMSLTNSLSQLKTLNLRDWLLKYFDTPIAIFEPIENFQQNNFIYDKKSIYESAHPFLNTLINIELPVAYGPVISMLKNFYNFCTFETLFLAEWLSNHALTKLMLDHKNPYLIALDAPSDIKKEIFYEIKADLLKGQHVNQWKTIIDSIYNLMVYLLYKPCLEIKEKKAYNGETYHTGLREIQFLSHIMKNLTMTNGVLSLKNLENNPAFSENYAIGKRYQLNFKNELVHLGKDIGLSFEDKRTFHDEVFLTEEAKNYLLSRGLGYMFQLNTLLNQAQQPVTRHGSLLTFNNDSNAVPVKEVIEEDIVHRHTNSFT